MLDFYTNNREWDVLEASSYPKKVRYSCCPEEYPEVTFMFMLQREAPGYRSLIVLPCLGKKSPAFCGCRVLNVFCHEMFYV